MSFLSGIKNFIKTEILGIEETNTKTQNADKKDKTPVIECKTEAPVDKFENKGTDSKQGSKSSSMSIKAMEQNIENIPSENFDLKKMLKNGLLEKITGKSKEEFLQLTNKEKTLLYNVVKTSIEKYDTLIKEGKLNKNANPEELIAAFSQIFYEALESGDFETAEEFQNEVGDVAAELGQDFDKQSDKVQRQMLKANRQNHDKKMQAELDAIKDLPENERKEAEARIHRRYGLVRRGRFIDMAAQKASNSVVNAMILLDSKDIQYGAKTALATRCSQEEKTKTADYASYDFTKSLIKDYKEVGDTVNAEDLKGYTQTFMEQKSCAAVNEYQKNYKADRDAYEAALQKQRNGEALSAEEKELLATMSSDYYTATAQGIGQGALNNVNMTNNEKAEFLAKWDSDAKQYNDYEVVTQNVKKALEQNPEHKEIKEKFVEIKQKVTKTEQASKTPVQQSENTIQTAQQVPAQKIEKPEQVKSAEAKNTVTKPENIAVNRQSANSIVIAQEIKEQGIDEAIKNYGSDAIQVILDNACFSHLRSKLTIIIKSYDLKNLKDISRDCSDSAFVFICSVVNKHFISDLIENREHSKGLCYAAEKLVQNMEGEHAVN